MLSEAPSSTLRFELLPNTRLPNTLSTGVKGPRREARPSSKKELLYTYAFTPLPISFSKELIFTSVLIFSIILNILFHPFHTSLPTLFYPSLFLSDHIKQVFISARRLVK